jgi:hypothetical protein
MLTNPDNEQELFEWALTIVEDGRAIRRGHETLWWEQLCIYGGDLWASYNPHSLRLEEPDAPDHRVRLAINLANPIVRTEYAKILKNKPILDWQARSGDKSDLDSAEVADKVWGHYCEKKFALPRVRRDAVMWALTCCMGAIFVDYDESADGEVEVVVDPEGNPLFDPQEIEAAQAIYKENKKGTKKRSIPRGEFRVVPLGPMQWGWDFSVTDYTDAAWGFVTETFDVNYVWRRWGKEVTPGKKTTPNLLEKRVLEKVDLMHRSLSLFTAYSSAQDIDTLGMAPRSSSLTKSLSTQPPTPTAMGSCRFRPWDTSPCRVHATHCQWCHRSETQFSSSLRQSLRL